MSARPMDEETTFCDAPKSPAPDGGLPRMIEVRTYTAGLATRASHSRFALQSLFASGHPGRDTPSSDSVRRRGLYGGMS